MTATNNQQPNRVNVYNLIILDESSSMRDIKREVIIVLNEIVRTIQETEANNPHQTHFVSLVSFNSIWVKTHLDRKSAREIEKFDKKLFRPESMSPLYDNLGSILLKLENAIQNEQDTAVLVSIITDGIDNASREFNRESIASLVERLHKKGWTFIQYGTNEDAEKSAMSINIPNSKNLVAMVEAIQNSTTKNKKRGLPQWALSKIRGNSMNDPMRGRAIVCNFDDFGGSKHRGLFQLHLN